MDHETLSETEPAAAEATAAETGPLNEPAVEAVSFADLGLDPSLVRAVEEKGYKHPTPIQRKAIPHILEGRDVIGSAQTGTGKTAAFALPILHRLSEPKGYPRCLVLEPTRELAHQVDDAFQKYGSHRELKYALLYGGVGYGKQREDLKAGADVLVATPGRLLDYISQRVVNLESIEMLVLDEVDRMLDMGFLPDVRKIVQKCPKQRQTLLFSATVPAEIDQLAGWALNDPVSARVALGISPAETIQHLMLPVDVRQKFDLLAALLDQTDYRSIIIFCRTKVGADTIARWLEAKGHKIAVLHADRRQSERQEALDGFRSGTYEVLVATDIVARGIDIRGVSHVINYDIPQNPEDYVHRIGRTGRAESEGDAYTLYTAGESEYLKAIERLIGREIPRVKLKGFDYAWSPVLEEKRSVPRKRNRGVSADAPKGRRRR